MHRDAGGVQIATNRLATDPERLLDAPKRPSEPTEGEDFLVFGVVQDVAHAGDRTRVPSRRQRLDRYREWPVFSCRSMAGFGCPPRVDREQVGETTYRMRVGGTGTRALLVCCAVGFEEPSVHPL